MRENKHRQPGQEEQGEGEGHFLLNVGKIFFLVAVLIAAWYFLEWLIGK